MPPEKDQDGPGSQKPVYSGDTETRAHIPASQGASTSAMSTRVMDRGLESGLYQDPSETTFDPYPAEDKPTPQAPLRNPVVGWVVVIKGPGRGDFRPVHPGQNSLGRGGDCDIKIDFGDTNISRDPHAYITY